MKILTSYPEHLSEKETVYLGHTHTPYTIKRIRPHRKGMLIFFEGISDRDEAELLRDLDVFTDMENAVPLDEGEYYLYQIEGIRVVTDEGRELGHLTDFIETGANDVYIITNEDGDELLIPAIPDVILDIDIDEHVMTVHLLEGLID